MITVDTSALAAILFGEPDKDVYQQAMFAANSAVIAAPIAFEFLLVTARRRPTEAVAAGELLRLSGLIIVPWTESHIAWAQDAFLRYGKGQGHPAQLNYGDCMSYALARALDVPLLYKGGDFGLTDVKSAV